jgi:type I restriction enzyme M protein
LRDVYVRGKYRDVILPFTVLRRLDAVLESTKEAVLERKKFLDTHKVAEQDGALRMAAGQPLPRFTLLRKTANRGETTSACKPSLCGLRLRQWTSEPKHRL